MPPLFEGRHNQPSQSIRVPPAAVGELRLLPLTYRLMCFCHRTPSLSGSHIIFLFWRVSSVALLQTDYDTVAETVTGLLLTALNAYITVLFSYLRKPTEPCLLFTLPRACLYFILSGCFTNCIPYFSDCISCYVSILTSKNWHFQL